MVDAPWKVPGAETSAFFNYNLTPAKWRAYIRDIQQAHAESRMQGRIQLYEPAVFGRADPDMPPELAAALTSKVRAYLSVGVRQFVDFEFASSCTSLQNLVGATLTRRRSWPLRLQAWCEPTCLLASDWQFVDMLKMHPAARACSIW